MRIRPAAPADAEAISALILSLAPTFTVNPDGSGAEEFFRRIAPAAIAGYLASPDYAYRVAEAEGALAGVVSILGNRHLHHLFVRAEFQGRGLSRRLWEAARDAALRAGNPGEFTVNSSPYAVPVYERFGFRPTGPREEKIGIAYVPMKLVLDGAAGT